MPDSVPPGDARRYGMRHIRFGLWTLVVFLALGLALEFLLGFKAEMYVSVINETRRFMWRLAHAHGTLTGLVHVVYGLLVLSLPGSATRRRRWVSPCLMVATLLLPGGFFAGGFGFYENDPGVGVFLAPVGAIALLLGILVAACDATTGGSSGLAPGDEAAGEQE